MNKKYEDIMFSHLMKTPSDTHIFTSGESRAFELGFTACYEEMQKDLREVLDEVRAIETHTITCAENLVFQGIDRVLTKLKSLGVE